MSITGVLVYFFLISSVIACDRCVRQTRVASFSDDTAVSSGACGYKSLALGLNDGYLAAAAPSIYRGGAGCGACFQVRCKNTLVCSKQGIRVFVSDLNPRNATGFLLSRNAFSALAPQGMRKRPPGVVDVEYKRVTCDHQKNLSLRVDESSIKPNYLAVEVMYQGGRTDMVGIDMAQVDSFNWVSMDNPHGVVWTSNRAARGALQFRFLVTAGYDGKWTWAKSVLPADWEARKIYDAGVQITDIAQENCSPCHRSRWR